MVDQYQGQVSLVIALINELYELEKRFDNIDNLLQDYVRLQYNVNNFNIQAIQDRGVFVRSHFDDPATNKTLVDAVQGFNVLKAKYEEANTVGGGTLSVAQAIAIALEGINR